MNKLPIHEKHQELNANFTKQGDCLLPFDYGDSSKEYDAARNSIAICDLSNRGKLKLSGKDHIKFLQGMLTNDVLELEHAKGVHAALLTVKGRMVSDMRVYKDEDSLHFDLEPGLNLKVSGASKEVQTLL